MGEEALQLHEADEEGERAFRRGALHGNGVDEEGAGGHRRTRPAHHERRGHEIASRARGQTYTYFVQSEQKKDSLACAWANVRTPGYQPTSLQKGRFRHDLVPKSDDSVQKSVQKGQFPYRNAQKKSPPAMRRGSPVDTGPLPYRGNVQKKPPLEQSGIEWHKTEQRMPGTIFPVRPDPLPLKGPFR